MQILVSSRDDLVSCAVVPELSYLPKAVHAQCLKPTFASTVFPNIMRRNVPFQLKATSETQTGFLQPCVLQFNTHACLATIQAQMVSVMCFDLFNILVNAGRDCQHPPQCNQAGLSPELAPSPAHLELPGPRPATGVPAILAQSAGLFHTPGGLW